VVFFPRVSLHDRVTYEKLLLSPRLLPAPFVLVYWSSDPSTNPDSPVDAKSGDGEFLYLSLFEGKVVKRFFLSLSRLPIGIFTRTSYLEAPRGQGPFFFSDLNSLFIPIRGAGPPDFPSTFLRQNTSLLFCVYSFSSDSPPQKFFFLGTSLCCEEFTSHDEPVVP